jgi:hypothetical protein
MYALILNLHHHQMTMRTMAWYPVDSLQCYRSKLIRRAEPFSKLKSTQR